MINQNLENKFKTIKVDLTDPVTKMLIKYPTRCINCRNREKCIDLRSFIVLLQTQV